MFQLPTNYFEAASMGKMSLTAVKDMEATPLILWAVPFMLAFVVLEFFLGKKWKVKTYEKKDTLASIGIGIGNLLSSAIAKAGLFVFAWAVYYYIAPFSIPTTWYTAILCFIIFDFWRYYAHYVGHVSRFWWSTHVPHHSSEEYNFSTTFRLSWIQHIKIIFFLPVLVMGFHPLVFFFCHQIGVLYQFWLHTKLIGKLPAPIEYIFITPSQHRVHHGTQPKYIDKNFGSTFSFWDRWFGTFQEEEEEVIYGITKPVNSYNPVYLIFHEVIAIYKDAKKARGWKEKKVAIFGMPGEFDKILEQRAKEVELNTEKEKLAKAG